MENMKQLFIANGDVIIDEVVTPSIKSDVIIVKTLYSCISAGTEVANIVASAEPLWRRAVRSPEKVKTVLKTAATTGISRTAQNVKSKLQAGVPSGYSLVGRVLEVGSDISNKEIRVGALVACMGAQCANHAEVVAIPENMCTVIPEGIDLKHAATVTLGTISLQGVRRANPTIGETFVVIGMGLLGQLTSQILMANGINVIAVDIDSKKLSLAEKLGVNKTVHAADLDHMNSIIKSSTGGYGADACIITASGNSDHIVSSAFNACRKKGRVILVGDVGLGLKRSDFYVKELDFLISSSYGPGRYDEKYEEGGLDYPISYVRWTENRNMQAYLQLVASGKINLDQLISGVYNFNEAKAAYNELRSESVNLISLLKYSDDVNTTRTIRYSADNIKRNITENINISVVGVGNFSQAMHLPNIGKLDKLYTLRGLQSGNQVTLRNAQKQFSPEIVTNDFTTIIEDEACDAVLISTRHHVHFDLLMKCIKAGKNVIVEKPLTLSLADLETLRCFYSNDSELKPMFLIGYNRRFSAHAIRLKSELEQRNTPVFINYNMNAGFIPYDHWVHTAEGGGRNVGEACHIYDLFCYFTDADISDFTVTPISAKCGTIRANDNFTATIKFVDGSVCVLNYFSNGNKGYPKETMYCSFDGKSYFIDDYQTFTEAANGRTKTEKLKLQDKGHLKELEEFHRCSSQGCWPIDFNTQIASAELALKIEECL